MEVFGWIMLSILGLAGIAALIMFAIPTIVESIKLMAYQMKKSAETKKLDVDAREEEKKIRDAQKRAMDKAVEDKKLELAQKKAEAKIQSINTKISDIDTKAKIAEIKNSKPDEVKEPELAIDNIETETKIEEVTEQKVEEEKKEVQTSYLEQNVSTSEE